MNINQIASRINRNFLRANRFEVAIGAPAVVGAPPRIVNENVCAVNYPGATYQSFDWRNAGPTIKVPYQVLFDDVIIQFYSDHQGAVNNWIRRWNNRIMTEEFRFEFWSEYTTDIKIKELNIEGSVVSTCTLVNAYPVTVSSVDLSFENQSMVEKISATFTYEYFQNS